MKNLLILLILSLCAVAWRSDDIVNALTMTGVVPNASAVGAQSLSAPHQTASQHAMSIEELSFLSKTDPQSGRKFISSRTVSERNAADKLMNFFSHGSYE